MRIWKTGVWMLLIVVVAIAIVAAGYGMAVVRHGFSARATPSSIEVFAANTARKLAMPSDYRQLRNPMPASPVMIEAGMKHFADHCAVCHANDGSGDTLFGKGLYPKPPDLRKAETQSQTDGELYYTIENGVRLTGMPAFGEHPGTTDGDTWMLVLFLRHLPTLTDDELAKMATLNPKTEDDRQEEKEEEEFLNGESPKSQDSKPDHR